MRALDLVFFKNDIISTSVLAWFVAQVLKVVFVLIEQKKLIFPGLWVQEECPVPTRHLLHPQLLQ